MDHFRGFESYWAVPYGETTARVGRWVKGPGMGLLGVLKAHFPDLVVIAEDLGYQTQEVIQMVLDSGFPGMEVLEFAFDARDGAGALPYSFKRNCACYTGTHDNVPIMGWVNEADPGDVDWARRYFDCADDDELLRRADARLPGARLREPHQHPGHPRRKLAMEAPPRPGQ